MRKYKPSKEQIQWGIVIVSSAFMIFIIYNIFFHASAITKAFNSIVSSLMAIIFGIIIAYISTPVLNFIEKVILCRIYKKMGIDVKNNKKKKKQMRTISVALTIGFVIFILYGISVLIVPQLFSSVVTIVRNIPVYSENITNFINNVMHSDPQNAHAVSSAIESGTEYIQKFIDDTITPQWGSIIQKISLSVYQIVMGIFNFVVGLIVSVYLMYNKEHLCIIGKKIAYALFNEHWGNEVVGLCRFIHRSFIGFFTGKILDSAIIGVLCYVVLLIIGTPFPVLMAFIIGVTNIIPFFGPIIGAIIGSIIIFMIDPLQALYFLIFAIILQQFDGNILGPKILGDSTGLSSFWVIFAIMFFGAIWGVTGWIVGVPLFAVIYALIRRIVNHYLRKKGIPTDNDTIEDLAYIENGEIRKLSDKSNKRYFASGTGSTWAKLFRIKPRNNNDSKDDK